MNSFRRFLRNNLTTLILYTVFFLTLFVPGLYKTDDLDLKEVGNSYPQIQDFSQSETVPNSQEITHFVHVTDTHLSIFRPESQDNLERFCKETIPSISPHFVVHTGDVVDGKEAEDSIFHSKQKESEWKLYKTVLQNHGYWNESFWFDVRGNHGSSAIKEKSSPNNYFYQFSPQSSYLQRTGKKRVNHYSYQHLNKTIHLLSIDYFTYPQAGLPYGFFGILSDQIITEFEDTLKNLKLEKNSEIILYGHSPLSNLKIDNNNLKRFKEILDQYSIDLYLTGHNHAQNEYSNLLSKKAPLLELELACFKDHMFYRVGVLNEGIFTFSDQSVIDGFPVMVIVNPSDARFIRKSEPLYNMRRQQIKVMVFSPLADLEQIKCLIDGEIINEKMKKDDKNEYLYFSTWDPSKYDKGQHEIEIQIKLEGNTKTWGKKQYFSLDGTRSRIKMNIFTTIQHHNLLRFVYFWFIFMFVYFIIFQTLLPKLLIIYLKKRNKLNILNKFQQQISDFENMKTFNILKIWKDNLYFLVFKNSHIKKSRFIYLMVIGFAILLLPLSVAPMIDGIWASSWTTFTIFSYNNKTYSHLFGVSLVLGQLFLTWVYHPTLQLFSSLDHTSILDKTSKKKKNYYCPNIIYLVMLILSNIIFVFFIYAGWGLLAYLLAMSTAWPSLGSLIWCLTIYYKSFKSYSKTTQIGYEIIKLQNLDKDQNINSDLNDIQTNDDDRDDIIDSGSGSGSDDDLTKKSSKKSFSMMNSNNDIENLNKNNLNENLFENNSDENSIEN
ncbi:helicase related [Anaeramoeba flamelloides]|uniref:Helicase related n=1 Tax=Anaeramoeba flamelloides TaxID=1746091 RepID=A0AAV8AH66_9EUKA|nr:helicase related [Anaeramoeba flamelloides]